MAETIEDFNFCKKELDYTKAKYQEIMTSKKEDSFWSSTLGKTLLFTLGAGTGILMYNQTKGDIHVNEYRRSN